jgi:hypothetical protein
MSVEIAGKRFLNLLSMGQRTVHLQTIVRRVLKEAGYAKQPTTDKPIPNLHYASSVEEG